MTLTVPLNREGLASAGYSGVGCTIGFRIS
jgi:hypothetical protein